MKKTKKIPWRPAVLVVAFGVLPLWAQSTSLEEGRFTIRQPDGAIAIDMIGTSNLDSFNAVVIGRADPGGSTRADVDFKIVDPLSALSPTDPALEFNASGALLLLGSGNVSAPGADGDLLIQDGMGMTTITLDGAGRNAIQVIDSSDVTMGNGFIKAWAKIKADGTIVSCWKCNTSTQATKKLATGRYQIDFQVGDISDRPVQATLSDHSGGATFARGFILAQPGAIGSAVHVVIDGLIINVPPELGGPVLYVPSDRAFTVVVL